MPKADLVCPQCHRAFAPPADRCAIDGSPLYGPEVMARIDKQIGSYMILDILGEGGMGVVYKAEHVMLKKPVAIKILHERFAKRKGAATQFLREARAASQIRHPNICDVTDFGEVPDGSLYFVMEYLEGESLEDVLGRDYRLPLHDTVNIVNQIALALGAAGDSGVVHQDLKPDNIFLINREGRRRIVRRTTGENFIVEPEGTFNFVKLLDFGVAKFAADDLGPGLMPKTGMVFGTPHYMSPEQAQGLTVDHRADIYSLGILFYEMLLGVVPFDYDRAIDILNGHVSGRVVPPNVRDPEVFIDQATNDTILRCLEKNPDERFQSMDELRIALRDCFTDRVYLRDVARLPGALEAGISPPPVPPPDPRRQQQTPQPVADDFPDDKTKKLNDDLAQLFAREAESTPTADEPVVLTKPTGRVRTSVSVPIVSSGDMPKAERPSLPDNDEAGLSKTRTGLGAVRPSSREDDDDPTGEHEKTKRRRITEPLTARKPS